MNTFQEFFKLGMKRDVPALHDIEAIGLTGLRLNLGSGHHPIEGCLNMDYPQWDAERDPLPFEDGTVAEIHAYHFLEHLSNPIRMLKECQRVLTSGGVLNIVVPYYTSQMQAHDLSHKHVFCEATWANLFNCDYDRVDGVEVKWEFDVGFNVIAGIVERNLALLTQLVRR